jgi:hypothetical protein
MVNATLLCPIRSRTRERRLARRQDVHGGVECHVAGRVV